MATRNIYTIIAALFAVLPIITFAQTDVLRLRIDGNNYSDETIIRFVSGATDQFDSDYDAWKLFSTNPQVPSLYTRIDSISPLSINAMPELVHKRVIDVYTNIGVAGNYTITSSELAPFQQGVCITLEDISNGSYYDLRSGLIPSFALAAGNNNGQPRFRIHINLPVVLTVSPPSCQGSSDGEVVLSKPGSSGWFYSLTDQSGNAVANGTSINDADTVTGLPAGSYNLTTLTPFGCPESSSFGVSTPSMAPVIISDTSKYLSMASIQFDAVAQGAVGYAWDLGDGSLAIGQSINHTYTSTGDYTVVLTVSSGTCTESVSRMVSVLPDPVITLVANIDGAPPIIRSAGNIVTVENIPAPEIQLSVHNMLGQVVLVQRLEANGGKVSVILNLPAGNYIAVISGNDQRFSGKIFIAGE